MLSSAEHLTLEVAHAHHIGVAEADTANARTDEVCGDGCAKASEAYNQDRCPGKLLLPGLAYFRQLELAGVTSAVHQSKILSQSFHTTSTPARRKSASTCAGVRSSLTANCSSAWGYV